MVDNNFCCRIFGLQQSYEMCQNLYWKMESVFVYLFLPLAGLTIIWRRHEIIAKLWPNVGQYFLHLPVTFHSFGKRKLLLNWAKQRLPPYWSSHMETLSGGIADFWNDGSLLCTLINTAVPGACPNPYKHWQKTPEHAQEVAYKYLGIVPIFTDLDFNSPLNPYLEKKLLHYLTLIRKTISQFEKDKLYYNFISTRYVVRGMGLYTAEQFKESEFYIYSKIQNPSFYNVEILILGPYSTYCKTTVLECLLKDSKKNQKDNESKPSNSWLKAKESYLDKLRNLNDSQVSTEKNIMIKVSIEYDRVKVSYMSRNFGVHEINISCNKDIVMGSPFYVNIIKSSNEPLKKADNKIPEDNNDSNNISITFYNKNKFGANSDSESKKGINQNNKDVIAKNNIPGEDAITESKNNKDINKIQNNINEINNYKNSTENIGNANAKMDFHSELSETNKLNLNHENTLGISKYLNDLKNKTTTEIKSNNEQQDDRPFYFTKENYSCFQKAVDCSFRRSCRITRKLPGLVQQKYAIVSGASPLCSMHSVPEDLGKLSVEERRKKFSLQRSLAIQEDMRKSSSFSVKKNCQEAPSANEKENNIAKENDTNQKPSDFIRINKNIFDKFVDIDFINKNNQDSRLYRIVKEKKLFWETVFQNSNYTKLHPEIIPNCNQDLQEDKYSKNDIPLTSQKQTDNKEKQAEKLYTSCGLKHVNSLRLLKTRTFSKSCSNLRYIDRKHSFKTYKSMDENLDQCCKISLDNRTKIYLDHISSFNSKSSRDIIHFINSKMDQLNKGTYNQIKHFFTPKNKFKAPTKSLLSELNLPNNFDLNFDYANQMESHLTVYFGSLLRFAWLNRESRVASL